MGFKTIKTIQFRYVKKGGNPLKKDLFNCFINLSSSIHVLLYATLFLVFVCLPPYSVHTQFKTTFTSSSLFSPSSAVIISILPSIYQSQMTNSLIFQTAHMTSRRYCHFAQNAYL